MDEPLIVGWGRVNIGEYPEQELRDSLRRAFIVHRADFITLDSNMSGQQFLSASVAWGLDNGILRHSDTDGDEQSEVYEFRLTDKGREELANG
jgi:hypothetical protein